MSLRYYAWTIAYHDGEGRAAMSVDSKEGAIDLACRLLRNGKDVNSITPPRGSGEKAMSVEEIHKLCAAHPRRHSLPD
jgi:hypothetical protein